MIDKIKTWLCNHNWDIIDGGIRDFNTRTGDTSTWHKYRCNKCDKTEIEYR